MSESYLLTPCCVCRELYQLNRVDYMATEPCHSSDFIHFVCSYCDEAVLDEGDCIFCKELQDLSTDSENEK